MLAGKKAWDTSGFPKLLYALNLTGAPVDRGTRVIFNRVGDFNREPYSPAGYALHTDNFNMVSWVVQKSQSSIIVEDVGSQKGVQATYSGGIFIPIAGDPKPLITTDPLSHYYNGRPPFSCGRRYFGYKTDSAYLVWLPGYGPIEKKFVVPYTREETGEHYDIIIEVDGQGNVKDLRGVYEFPTTGTGPGPSGTGPDPSGTGSGSGCPDDLAEIYKTTTPGYCPDMYLTREGCTMVWRGEDEWSWHRIEGFEAGPPWLWQILIYRKPPWYGSFGYQRNPAYSADPCGDYPLFFEDGGWTCGPSMTVLEAF